MISTEKKNYPRKEVPILFRKNIGSFLCFTLNIKYPICKDQMSIDKFRRFKSISTEGKFNGGNLRYRTE